ncbi:MAG: helix-turn-helix domain-containing protein [Alphaproteobacteria bacterium]
MAQYRYTECGLDNVIIDGVEFIQDDFGEEVVCIPNVNDLHIAITKVILEQKASMSGRELRFLRTELGLTQAQLAELVRREPLSISRWERGECPLDSNAEALIRIYAMQTLKMDNVAVKDIISWCVTSAAKPPIHIDGSDPDNYRPLAA